MSGPSGPGTRLIKATSGRTAASHPGVEAPDGAQTAGRDQTYCPRRPADRPTRPIGSGDGPLPEEVVESVALLLRILADPTRIRLIETLNAGGDTTVGALSVGLPLTRQGVSRQLGILHRAGLVRRRRDGMCVRYELADWTGWWLVEQLADAITPESGP